MEYSVYNKNWFMKDAREQKIFRNIALIQGKTMLSNIGGDVVVPNVQLFITDENGIKQKEVLPDGTEVPYAETENPSNDPTLNQTSLNLQYREKVQLTANEPVTWSSDSRMVRVDEQTGEIESVQGFIKTGKATITATSLDGQRVYTYDITITPAWWQWLVIVPLFGWIWY